MKLKLIFYISGIAALIFIFLVIESCRSSRITANYQSDTLYTNINGEGNLIELTFQKGSEHNHPLMAIWIEDTSGNYIQTLYIAKSIAKSEFAYGDTSNGKWVPGPVRRPASLPVWAHSRGIKENDGLYVPMKETAIPDAYTGPTPQAHFTLQTRSDSKLPARFYVYFEINQTWDWNEYWTNNKYPQDKDYMTSAQPALVYRVLLNMEKNMNEYHFLQLIGHSHYSGKDGKIYDELNTITTAKHITETISVRILE